MALPGHGTPVCMNIRVCRLVAPVQTFCDVVPSTNGCGKPSVVMIDLGDPSMQCQAVTGVEAFLCFDVVTVSMGIVDCW